MTTNRTEWVSPLAALINPDAHLHLRRSECVRLIAGLDALIEQARTEADRLDLEEMRWSLARSVYADDAALRTRADVELARVKMSLHHLLR